MFGHLKCAVSFPIQVNNEQQTKIQELEDRLSKVNRWTHTTCMQCHPRRCSYSIITCCELRPEFGVGAGRGGALLLCC